MSATAQLTLRQQAEARLKAQEGQPSAGSGQSSAEEASQVLHELRVHQLELEMQNEELRRAQTELDAARARYFDLYDLAPVGYFTVSDKGLIREANLTAVALLGATKGTLVARPFSQFICHADQDRYYLFHRQLLATGQPQGCDLQIVKPDGTHFWGHLQGNTTTDATGATVFQLILSDITARKQAEQRLRMFSQEILAARENERKQVASDLHHDVGSLAVGLSAYFDAIEQDLRSGKAKEALQWVRRTRKLFDKSVAHLKGVAVHLRPPELDLLGLRAALRQHFAQITRHRGTRIHFRETLGRRRIAEDTATILFRIVQETLTNAITHGQATRVDVNLRAAKEAIRLTIRNNGKGFDPSASRAPAQIGLLVMREMATFAGGTFTIDSQRGAPTTVRVSLPLTAATLAPGTGTLRAETLALGTTARGAGRGLRSQDRSGA